ncbi:related to AP-1-like transcription factor [Phialocephala subalpina]|jgi:hypothetical protein|uniref:Putative transcription factor kapC n=1 Tax=Phialocephala subalpina TaxID=576137 RepID=A0A1L7WK14_9HELO|nr:related to AP-1-like transcription factor [Phialocephala subalpina]
MAAGQYNNNSVDDQSYLIAPDMNGGMYDGTSSESSASSPLNCNGFDNLYGANGFMPYPAFPMQYPMNGEGMTPLGLIPVELDIEGLYEDHDRRRRKNGSEKTVSSHVHSRRRAQNRASQRAFRDRKEKHMRELEQRLSELEGRHSDLSRSYESLQLEYTSVKQELDKLRKDNTRVEGSSRNYQSREWEESKPEILDPLLFDVSAFCFDQDDGSDRKD